MLRRISRESVSSTQSSGIGRDMTGTWEAEGWERCRWEGRDFAAEASDCRHGSGRSHTAWVLVVTREHGPGESGMNSEVGCKGNGVLWAGADGQWPCCKELLIGFLEEARAAVEAGVGRVGGPYPVPGSLSKPGWRCATSVHVVRRRRDEPTSYVIEPRSLHKKAAGAESHEKAGPRSCE